MDSHQKWLIYIYDLLCRLSPESGSPHVTKTQDVLVRIMSICAVDVENEDA
jgi:hypothetical protein